MTERTASLSTVSLPTASRVTVLGATLTTALAIAPLGSQPYAQESADSLAEVVVTARRREESLQTAPVAVTALGGEAIAAMNARNSTDLDNAVPNVMVEVAPINNSGATAAVFIRGIGQSDFTLNTDPGVGIFVDGVYLARSVGAVLDLLDLERVEVLRGPQGTLFGRNTIGGAINFVTRKPSEEFGGHATLTAGSRERIDFKGTVDLPVSERLLTKFSFMSTNSDGYVDVIEKEGMELGDENQVAGRATFRFLPTDELTVDLAFDVTSSSDNGAPMILTGLSGTSFFTGFYNDFLTGGQCSPAPGPLTNPICYNDQWLTGRDETHGQPELWYSQLDIWGSSLTIAWNLPNDFVLTSLTSYRETDSEVSREQDRSPLPLNTASNDWTHEQWAQELQLSRATERLKWIVGLYAFGEEGTDINDVSFPIGRIRSGGSVDNDNYAAYGNVTFSLTPKLGLDVGLRYTSDEKRFTPNQFFLSDVFLGPPPPVPAGTRIVPQTEVSRKFTETTPAVSLAYEWTDQFMTYARYSEGFKSGGFTQRVAFPRPDVPSFAPEYVEVYEIGAKSTTLENRLRVNVAAFYTDYTDLQVNFLESPTSPAPITGNAAAANLKGGELEISAVPVDGLRIDAALGYLDAKYESFAPGALLTTANRPVYAPKWTGSFALSYAINAGSAGVVTPRLDYSYRSAVEYDAFNDPRGQQGDYSLVHAGLAWDIDDRWRASVDVNNLFDKFYITSAFVDINAAGYAEAGYGRPREWMVSVRRSF